MLERIMKWEAIWGRLRIKKAGVNRRGECVEVL